MPGHGVHARFGTGLNGGPRGWYQPAKEPTVLMGPPQRGQGGRTSVAASRVSGSGSVDRGGGGVPRIVRMWARAAFRFELARKP